MIGSQRGYRHFAALFPHSSKLTFQIFLYKTTSVYGTNTKIEIGVQRLQTDLKRLAPEETVDLEVTPLQPSYTEDAELETPTEGDQMPAGTDEYSPNPEFAIASVG